MITVSLMTRLEDIPTKLLPKRELALIMNYFEHTEHPITKSGSVAMVVHLKDINVEFFKKFRGVKTKAISVLDTLLDMSETNIGRWNVIFNEAKKSVSSSDTTELVNGFGTMTLMGYLMENFEPPKKLVSPKRKNVSVECTGCGVKNS